MAVDLDFKELVTSYYQALYKFAFSLTRSEADASDLTQETFRIWATKGHQLKDPTKVKQWLFTTLHREFLGMRRRYDRFPHYELEGASHELPDVPPQTTTRVDTSLVIDALAHVSETYRATVVLFYLEDYTYKEIADVLDIPIGTVQSRLSRGLSQLQHYIRSRDSSGNFFDSKSHG